MKADAPAGVARAGLAGGVFGATGSTRAVGEEDDHGATPACSVCLCRTMRATCTSSMTPTSTVARIAAKAMVEPEVAALPHLRRDELRLW